MPPWQTVYSHLLRYRFIALEQTRRDVGEEPSPTVAIIDSQSVKTTELALSRGFDAHKKVKGRKRSPIRLAFHFNNYSAPRQRFIEPTLGIR